MSVRAYKVKKIETEGNPTFNCWEHPEIIDLSYNPDQYSDGGQLTFNREQIEWGLTEEGIINNK